MHPILVRNQLPETKLLNLDFAKTYDRVHWSFFQKTVECLKFGPVFREFLSKWYQNRTSALAINCHITPRFSMSRVVQQGDPITPFLFVNEMNSQFEMTKWHRAVCGIHLSHKNALPTGPFLADDSLPIANSAEFEWQLYKEAEKFCQGFGAKLHPGKCVAIPIVPYSRHQLANGIHIFSACKLPKALGILTGCNISREQFVASVLNRVADRYKAWKSRARTHWERAVVATSIILATIWYVLGALPVHRKDTMRIQRLVNQNMRNHKNIPWGKTQRWSQMNLLWISKSKKSGCEITPVSKTVESQRLGLP